MRLIFLYVRDGGGDPGIKYDPSIETTNFYASRIKDEGYYYMLRRMIETNIIDELMIFIESNKNPGFIKYDKKDKIYGHVMPNINSLFNYIRKDDIIFVRGGWKNWYDPLQKLKNAGHKLMVYAANTGREKWSFWDVVLNDLNADNKVDRHGRLQFDFKKPTNPELFYHIPDTKMVYDLCLGSSHIHDKKGQHKTINSLLKYREIFNEDPVCIMPGSVHRGAETNKAIAMLEQENLNVSMPGMVDRKDLNKIYNQSKILIHLGGGGQGDRAPLEAMRCGCSTIIGNTRRHSKLLYQNKELCTVFPEDITNEEIARELYYKIKIYDIKNREKLYRYYEDNVGIETVILPDMKKIINILKGD